MTNVTWLLEVNQRQTNHVFWISNITKPNITAKQADRVMFHCRTYHTQIRCVLEIQWFMNHSNWSFEWINVLLAFLNCNLQTDLPFPTFLHICATELWWSINHVTNLRLKWDCAIEMWRIDCLQQRELSFHYIIFRKYQNIFLWLSRRFSVVLQVPQMRIPMVGRIQFSEDIAKINPTSTFSETTVNLLWISSKYFLRVCGKNEYLSHGC